MRPLYFLVPLLLLAPSAAAHHCTTWSTSNPEVTILPFEGGEVWYIDNDPCQPECLFSIWVYPESNGIPGLQRGDEVVDDTCHGMIDPDTWLF